MSVNLLADERDGERARPGWRWRRLAVGERLAPERIGASVHELAPRCAEAEVDSFEGEE